MKAAASITRYLLVLAIVAFTATESAAAQEYYEVDHQDPFCTCADGRIWGDICYAFLMLWGGDACTAWPDSCPGQCEQFGFPPPPDCPQCPWSGPCCDAGGGSGPTRPACCQVGSSCLQVSCYVILT